jgi:hypothetical protein
MPGHFVAQFAGKVGPFNSLYIIAQWIAGLSADTKLGRAPTPVQQTGSNVAQTCPTISTFPARVDGSACTSSLSRIAQSSLMLRPVRLHGRLRDRHPRASDISSPPRLPRLLPAGASRVDLSSTRKCRLCAKKAGIAIWALDSPTLFGHSAADLSLSTADRQIGCLNLGRVHFGRLVAKKHSAATNPSHRILLSHLLRPAKNGSLLVVMAPPLIIDDRRSLI